MKTKSVEAKVLDARAKVAALRGDERADYPSGPERTAYNKELKNAVKLLAKWETAFAVQSPGGSGALRPSGKPGKHWSPNSNRWARRGDPPAKIPVAEVATTEYGPPRPSRAPNKRRKGIIARASYRAIGPLETRACRGCLKQTIAPRTFFEYESKKNPNPSHCGCGCNNWGPVELPIMETAIP